MDEEQKATQIVQEIELNSDDLETRSGKVSQEQEISEDRYERLEKTVQSLMELMEQILPGIGRRSMASPSSEAQNETPEPSLKKPWERRRSSPTFT